MYIRSLTPPFLSLFIFMMSVGFFLTYTSLRMKIEGYDTFTIGFISSGYYMGFLLGALRIKEFINRIQHRRAFVILAGTLIAATMVQGLFINKWAWFLTRFVSGICISGFFVVMQSWFLAVSPYHNRGRVFSIYMVGVYSAISMSQFFLDIVETTTLMPFLLSGFLCSISLAPVTLTNSEIPKLQKPLPRMIFKIWKKSPFGVASCLSGGALLGSIYTFLPLFAVEYHFSVSQLMFAAIFGSVFFQFPSGWLSDYLNKKAIILATCLLIILPGIVVFIHPQNGYLVYAGTFMMSGLCFIVYPMGITLTCDRLEEIHLTTATGALLFAFGLGAISGPIAAPLFISHFTYSGLYLFIAAVSFLLMIIGILTIFFFTPPPSEEPKDYESPSSIRGRLQERLKD